VTVTLNVTFTGGQFTSANVVYAASSQPESMLSTLPMFQPLLFVSFNRSTRRYQSRFRPPSILTVDGVSTTGQVNVVGVAGNFRCECGDYRDHSNRRSAQVIFSGLAPGDDRYRTSKRTGAEPGNERLHLGPKGKRCAVECRHGVCEDTVAETNYFFSFSLGAGGFDAGLLSGRLAGRALSCGLGCVACCSVTCFCCTCWVGG
jgi:hypothetical protein